ncbi:hypothetical protein SDC9_145351 [bioreactor metagenome]|uniref:Uncharacterized protein n=1 Tax=bioreactor metagenome TaxID=1076179 RepID=A0A645EAL1_9ZZZZ
MLWVVPCIGPRQQQHAGIAHSNLINQAIGHHRQPTHRMDRRFGNTDRFQRDLRCVLFEKTTGM